MENIIFEIEKEKVEVKSIDFFLRSSGLNREGEKFNKMRDSANKIKKEIVDRVNIRAIVSYFDEFNLEGDTLTIKGNQFICNPFVLMKKENIKGIYVYVITGGDYYLDDRPILDQLFADMWGTAYVDAGRENLAERIFEDFKKRNTTDENIIISSSFGPGFYGMETGDVVKIFNLVDGEKIGVTCRDRGLMVPLKSCAGIYIAVESTTELPEFECETCLGNGKNCNFCNVRGNDGKNY